MFVFRIILHLKSALPGKYSFESNPSNPTPKYESTKQKFRVKLKGERAEM